MNFDFSKVDVKICLSKEWILKQLDDATIFYFYFGKFKLNTAYKSFFDKNDKNPSTAFFLDSSGRIAYYDFRTQEKLDCFGFVKKLYGINFRQALEQIASDFGLIDKKTRCVPQALINASLEVDKTIKAETLIQFEPDRWNSTNLQFWRLFEITEAELIAENVFPVKHLFLNHLEITNPNNYTRYAYVETLINKNKGVKIYSPYDPILKHMTNIPLSNPFGLNDLPFDDDQLVIVKSKKDLICAKKFFSDVIATQNESAGSLTEELIKDLQSKYKILLLIWDADEVGINNSKKMCEQWGMHSFTTPQEDYKKYGLKDLSDYIKAYSTEALADLFDSCKIRTLWH